MSIENCLVKPNFGETHQAKNYQNILKIGDIDGADEYTKIDISDVISDILLLFQKLHIDGSLKESICLKNLHIDRGIYKG